MDLRAYLRDIEKKYLEAYLQTCEGNKEMAAKLLGMSRTTMIYRLKRLRMNHWVKVKGEVSQ